MYLLLDIEIANLERPVLLVEIGKKKTNNLSSSELSVTI